MKFFPPRSLQQRFTLFMLLPVALSLFGMGLAGFLYARDALLTQWGEAALLKLEWAAHQIDMRLSLPKSWLVMLRESADTSPRSVALRNLILRRLRSMPGVVRVELSKEERETPADLGLFESTPDSTDSRLHEAIGNHHGMMHHPSGVFEITPPRYDPQIRDRTVSLISDLKDATGTTVGHIEVVIGFDYLISAVEPADWWQSQKAFLIDDNGRILAGAGDSAARKLGDSGNDLELKTLAQMKGSPSGTIIGGGHPPRQVSGFYRLKEAPWNLVLFAPGKTVLSPIIRFRLYYFIIAATFILFILILIRIVTGHTAAAIKELTVATRNVANGTYYAPLIPRSEDEVGELVRHFNSMTLQLEERVRLKQALELAEEVQQNLLPKSAPAIPGLDIAGVGLFSDEIGGDYYDYIDRGHIRPGAVGIVVGDVSDHGIPSALLMASVRAVIRQRMALPGPLNEAMTDINRQLSADVEDSGRFVTLFYADIDIRHQEMRWVRAGHDAAFSYDPSSDAFSELSDKSIALGVMDHAVYSERRQALTPGQMILIGTDGIWETQNSAGHFFGKSGFFQIIRDHHHLPAAEIITVVLEKLRDFRCPREQTDDITLVIIKVSN